jgi:hypothetical protein
MANVTNLTKLVINRVLEDLRERLPPDVFEDLAKLDRDNNLLDAKAIANVITAHSNVVRERGD